MLQIKILISFTLYCLIGLTLSAQTLRPPAVPLVTFNPFLSIWSEATKLTDKNTQHWTHREHALISLIRIDGKTYRLMGTQPTTSIAFAQISVKVTPTRSIYEFEQAGVHVTLTFLTAALPNDIDIFSRPLSYITWDVRSVDGKAHKVELYSSASSQLTVNNNNELVAWSKEIAGNLTAMRIGTQMQNVLGSWGDDHRIDWGYAYLAAPTNLVSSSIGENGTLQSNFVTNGGLPANDDTNQPRTVDTQMPVMAFAFNLDSVRSSIMERQVIVAYDEVYAIKFFSRKLRPYWRRNGMEAAALLQAAANDYTAVLAKCISFDDELVADLMKVGGSKYAQLTALAYRQCTAACGLAADENGKPLFFTKENTSNGDIATVDVIFPMDPVWILLSPTLAKASIVPILAYAASDHWKFPNAPHDLGDYPIAMGRDDGGEGMPVEESGNMILICDAIAHAEGNVNFVSPWWDKITQWAQYLEQYGLDPENQLCTDDFMGHLAHNANLSIKAILALAAYGDLCKMRGDMVNAQKYAQLAKTDAAHWVKVADDGDHYRLAFDMPNTWSQKYNLVWDKLLGLNVFSDSVAAKEIAYYKSVCQQYGLPLDSRTKLSKTDWSFWTATMTKNQADFDAFVNPAYDYFNLTTVRDPLSDSYYTDNINSGGMHARPVIGGFFIKMLSDTSVWHKWAKRDKQIVTGWAKLPLPPEITEVVTTSKQLPVSWKYTTTQPNASWINASFDDSGWSTGYGGFGTSGTPGAVVNTFWGANDIWIRRKIAMPVGTYSNLQLYVYHDEDIEIYFNGTLAASAIGYTTNYEIMDISPQALALLTPGASITIAAHCHQTGGGQAVDVGIANVKYPGLTGIQNIVENNDNYSIYPNPSKGLINILSKTTGPLKVKLIDQKGTVILDNTYQNQFIQLNIEKYSNLTGLYYLMITSPNNTIVKKVVLTHD